MKNKVLMSLILIIFTMVLMLLMSNTAFATNLSKIEIAVPHPTIGKTLAKVSEVTVVADGSEKFEVFQVDWMEYDYSTKLYKDVTDLTKKVGPDEKYLVTVHYKRPDKYEITNSTKVTLNGKNRNMDNPEEFNNYGGETDYCYDGVGYYFEYSQVQKNLSKIEVTVPHPTIGKTLAKVSEVTVVADGSEKFEVFQVDWMEYDYSTKLYKDVTDLTKKVGPDEKYLVTVHYKRPDKYGITNSTKVTLNGKSRNMDDPEEFNNYGGETDYCYDGVGYYFGYSQVQKNLSKIEVTVPAPTIGKTLAKASEVIVIADGSENLKVNRIEWFRYNSTSNEYESVTDTSATIQANEKYEILVDYSRPNKYGVTTSTKITVNGNSRDLNNIDEYNAYGGDIENDYAAVCYKFEETKAEDTKQENNTEQTTKPSTTIKPSTSTTTKPITTKPTNTKTETSKAETTNKEDANEEINNESKKENETDIKLEENIIIETIEKEELEENNKQSTDKAIPYKNIILIGVAVVGIILVFIIEIKVKKTKK